MPEEVQVPSDKSSDEPEEQEEIEAAAELPRAVPAEEDPAAEAEAAATAEVGIAATVASHITAPWEKEEPEDAARHTKSREWEQSLRPERTGPAPRGRAWEPQLTVARGPRFATEARTGRSRSTSASRDGTPLGTPRRSTTPLRGAAGVAEQEQRRPSASPMRRKLDMQASLRTRSGNTSTTSSTAVEPGTHRTGSSSRTRAEVAAIAAEQADASAKETPATSIVTSQDTNGKAVPTKPVTTPAGFTFLTEARSRIRSTSAQRTDADSSGAEATGRPAALPVRGPATVYAAAVLQMERRARSRSASAGSEQSSSQAAREREAQATQRHLERITTAKVLARSRVRTEDRSLAEISASVGQQGVPREATAEQERWIREATTAAERASRAKTVAKNLRDEAQQAQREKLCIFKAPVDAAAKCDEALPSTGSPASAAAGGA